MTTSKPLATAIRLTLHGVNVQTVVASLRSIARVNKNQFYAKLNRFVVYELPQLIKTPTVRKSALSFPTRQRVRAFSDSGQFFQGNYLIIILGRLNDLVVQFCSHIRKHPRTPATLHQFWQLVQV